MVFVGRMEKQAEMKWEMKEKLIAGFDTQTSALNLKPPVKRGGTKKTKALNPKPTLNPKPRGVQVAG